jgi:hypothetical protein
MTSVNPSHRNLRLALISSVALSLALSTSLFFADRLHSSIPTGEALCNDPSSLSSALSDTSLGKAFTDSELYSNSALQLLKYSQTDAEDKVIYGFAADYARELRSILTQRHMRFFDILLLGSMPGSLSVSHCIASVWMDFSQIVSDLESLQNRARSFARAHPEASLFVAAATSSLSGDDGMIPGYSRIAGHPPPKRPFRMEFYAMVDAHGKIVTQLISETPPGKD